MSRWFARLVPVCRKPMNQAPRSVEPIKVRIDAQDTRSSGKQRLRLRVLRDNGSGNSTRRCRASAVSSPRDQDREGIVALDERFLTLGETEPNRTVDRFHRFRFAGNIFNNDNAVPSLFRNGRCFCPISRKQSRQLCNSETKEQRERGGAGKWGRTGKDNEDEREKDGNGNKADEKPGYRNRCLHFCCLASPTLRANPMQRPTAKERTELSLSLSLSSVLFVFCISNL